MSLFQALIFGLVQGLTEFLPISSSAHLILLPRLFQWNDPGLAFNVALHWGTMVGVLVYFKDDTIILFKAWMGTFFDRQEQHRKLSWQIFVATIPAAVIGYFLEDLAETAFRSPLVIATTLIGVGVILFVADKKTTHSISMDNLPWPIAVSIGFAQALALIPGVSRSGITIAAGLMLALNRSTAVRFSFLLSIPIILGAGLLKLDEFIANFTDVPFWVGFISAAVSGYMAIAFLVNYVRNRSFLPFVIYRVVLGLFIFYWFL